MKQRKYSEQKFKKLKKHWKYLKNSHENKIKRKESIYVHCRFEEFLADSPSSSQPILSRMMESISCFCFSHKILSFSSSFFFSFFLFILIFFNDGSMVFAACFYTFECQHICKPFYTKDHFLIFINFYLYKICNHIYKHAQAHSLFYTHMQGTVKKEFLS